MGRWQDGANGRGLDRCEVEKIGGKKKTKMLLLLEHKPTQKKQTDLDENISAVRN